MDGGISSPPYALVFILHFQSSILESVIYSSQEFFNDFRRESEREREREREGGGIFIELDLKVAVPLDFEYLRSFSKNSFKSLKDVFNLEARVYDYSYEKSQNSNAN